ncbi:olfactory receptor 4K2-like [Fukomys damarensis]|uniref:olfactory receptor 4K2-like n=1 Tax=Fukomys damarensis TaxID=885580 RepID=UPI00053F4399|nr:olfactory receptor 4K2-like [Fukomys damarensis]XP_010625727.1 olfactory receptor 4K2-like [Fukomys damarensis]
MEVFNHSRVSEFVLLGLTDSLELQIFFFALFSIFYLMTMFGNCLIMFTVLSTSNLHFPMYFLLSNLSLIDMCLSSFATPKMIMDLFAQHKTISFGGCMSQIFFLHLFTGTEIVLLISMSFDRYTAICKPLYYSKIMSPKMCIGLVVMSWTVGFLHTISQLAFTLYLPFCGPNVIDSFFCDLPLVIQLACIDIYVLGIFMISTSGVIALISFLLLLTSYVIVLVTIRDHSSTRSSKALSTCTAHFIVVLMFFGPCIFIYVWPFTSFLVDKTLSVFYTIFTPFLNPLIYTLRNQEVKAAVKKKLCNQYFHFGKTNPHHPEQ